MGLSESRELGVEQESHKYIKKKKKTVTKAFDWVRFASWLLVCPKSSIFSLE